MLPVYGTDEVLRNERDSRFHPDPVQLMESPTQFQTLSARICAACNIANVSNIQGDRSSLSGSSIYSKSELSLICVLFTLGEYRLYVRPNGWSADLRIIVFHQSPQDSVSFSMSSFLDSPQELGRICDDNCMFSQLYILIWHLQMFFRTVQVTLKWFLLEFTAMAGEHTEKIDMVEPFRGQDWERRETLHCVPVNDLSRVGVFGFQCRDQSIELEYDSPFIRISSAASVLELLEPC